MLASYSELSRRERLAYVFNALSVSIRAVPMRGRCS